MTIKFSEVSGLKTLGSGVTDYPNSYDSDLLEVIPNQWSDDYRVRLNCSEFTALCPKTKQPDFGEINILYVPGRWIVETKSLKLYLFSFRNEGVFQEDVTNIIKRDLYVRLEPKMIEVDAVFRSRGGIAIRVQASRYPVPEMDPSTIKEV